MNKHLILIFALCTAAFSSPRLYGLVSIGEAPFKPISDIGGSTPVFQTGISLEYRTTYLSPYSKSLIGYYNHGLFLEEYFGIQLGAKIRWIKPAITFGTGIQSANEKQFTLGDEFETNRKIYFPFGFGARLDAFEKIFGEWDWRVNGYPWWKLEFGYRMF